MNSIIFFLFIAFGCSDQCLNKRSIEVPQNDFDTIKANIFLMYPVTDACYDSVNSYYKKFGIYISKYYLVKDTLDINLNQDDYVDKILILSPVCLERINQTDCRIDSPPSRLLVEILNENDKGKIINIFSNLVSNIGGPLSKYNGMTKTALGFAINHQAGEKYSWKYTIEFIATKQNSLKLKKICKICSVDELTHRVIYKYRKQDIDRINVNDSINANCQCDEIWKNLEKKQEGKK